MRKHHPTDLDSIDRSTDPVFLQTIRDRLAVSSNNYSDIESLFQAGGYAPLVDTTISAGLSEETAARFQRTRLSFIRSVLQGGAQVPSISIIVPVYGGAQILAQCLLSIARQSFVSERPRDVQLIVIEDGVVNSESVFVHVDVRRSLDQLGEKSVVPRLLRLKTNQGRGQARNLGLSLADFPLVLFVDASMVMERDFLVEHIWRHARLKRDVALLSFKENISWSAFQEMRGAIESGACRPDFRSDWKWHHTLKSGEMDTGGFLYNGQCYESGDAINYMLITNQLKLLSGFDEIGHRTLPSFFQTNVVSVRKESVLSVGGFEPKIQGWGLEDTFLGSLLVSNGCYLIPCPSAVAFNIESDGPIGPEKLVDLDLNRIKYHELISKTQIDDYSHQKFQTVIDFLHGKIEEVGESQKLPTDQVQVADLCEVLKLKWDGQRLLDEITRLDYSTMDALTPAHAGSPKQWLPVFWDHPDSWRVIFTAEPAVVGYWHFVALFEEEFEKAMAGKLSDETISASRVQSFEMPGIYNIYMAGFAIHPVFRNTTTKLLLITSFFEVLRELAKNGVYIQRICTNAFTSEGESLCKTLRFQNVRQHVDHGEIYSIRVVDFLDQTIAARYSDLRNLYRSKFSADYV